MKPPGRSGGGSSAVLGTGWIAKEGHIRAGTVFVSATALTLVTGCAFLAWSAAAMDADVLLLVLSTCGFALLAGIYALQVRRVVSTGRCTVSLCLLILQAILAVALLFFGGWVWHGATGLLAGAVLVVLPTRHGKWAVAVITASIAPIAVLLSLPWEQFVHWLCCHLVVVGVTCSLMFSIRFLKAQEWAIRRNERARLSSEIHDILGRTIAGVAFQGQLLHKMSSGDPALQDEVQNLLLLTRGARSDIRAVVTSSRSTSLREEVALAHTLLRDVSIDLTENFRPCVLPRSVEQALALTLREAVTNILLHSKASEVHLSLSRVGTTVIMKVRNNGADGEPTHWGMGLKGSSERCQDSQGEMEVKFAPPDEFLLTCSMQVE